MKELFSNKNFTLLWLSQMLSQITINVVNFLVIVRVYEQTNSTIASSLIWVAYAMPAIIIGPIGAASVDFADRRKILIFATISQATSISIYALLYDQYLYLSYIAVFFYSFFNQFYVPAESASLPYVVHKKHLIEANSMFFITQQISLIGAFVISGIIAESLGIGIAFAFAASLLLIAFLAVYHLPSMRVGHISEKLEFKHKVVKFFTQVLEGFRFIFVNKNILYPFLLLLTLWTLMAILTVELPAISKEIVKIKATFSGIAIVLPAGVGALIGTALITKFQKKLGRKKIVSYGLMLLSLVFVSVPLVEPLLNFWLSRTLVVLAFTFAGIGYVASLIPSLTYIQEVTPEKMMGRVMGYFWFVSSIVGIIPVMFSATLTELFGVRMLLIIFGFTALGALMFLKYYIPRGFSNLANE